MPNKPGYKTTEFWLTLLVVIINQALPLALLYGVPEEEASAWRALGLAVLDVIGSGLAVAAYSYGRSNVKSAWISAD